MRRWTARLFIDWGERYGSSAKPPARVNLEHLRVARYVPKPPDLESFLQIGVVLKEILLEGHNRRARE